MRILLIIGLLFSGLFLTSCHSSKQLAGTRGQREQLSHQLGIKLSRKDDLRLYSEAAKWLGTPYRYGGTTRKGVDCSGLVGQIYLS